MNGRRALVISAFGFLAASETCPLWEHVRFEILGLPVQVHIHDEVPVFRPTLDLVLADVTEGSFSGTRFQVVPKRW